MNEVVLHAASKPLSGSSARRVLNNSIIVVTVISLAVLLWSVLNDKLITLLSGTPCFAELHSWHLTGGNELELAQGVGVIRVHNLTSSEIQLVGVEGGCDCIGIDRTSYPQRLRSRERHEIAITIKGRNALDLSNTPQTITIFAKAGAYVYPMAVQIPASPEI